MKEGSVDAYGDACGLRFVFGGRDREEGFPSSTVVVHRNGQQDVGEGRKTAIKSRNDIANRARSAVACVVAAVLVAMLLIPRRAAADERIDDRVIASRLHDRLADARIEGLRLSREAVEDEEIVSVRRVTAPPKTVPSRERAAVSRLLKTRRVAATVR